MKRIHLFLLVISFSPLHTIKANDSLFQRKAIYLPLQWQLQVGCNYLTNTHWSSNKPLQDAQTLSGAFYTFLDLPLKKSGELSPFRIHIGIGPNIQTFGLDKLIRYKNDQTIFVAFKPDEQYLYSYLQQVFVDVPLGFIYCPSAQVPFDLETGGIAGYQVYSEHRFCIATANGSIVQTDEHIKNLNPFHYGVYGKVCCNRLSSGHTYGLSYSISGNYYFSELFKSVNDTPTKNFSILLGIGFLINHH
jgi:hypothetical protein